MNFLRNHRFFTSGSQYRRELLSELRILIIVALGFTIAFTWRQTIFDISQSFVQFLTNIQSSTALSILTSTFITLISIIIILIISKFLAPSTY